MNLKKLHEIGKTIYHTFYVRIYTITGLKHNEFYRSNNST